MSASLNTVYFNFTNVTSRPILRFPEGSQFKEEIYQKTVWKILLIKYNATIFETN